MAGSGRRSRGTMVKYPLDHTILTNPHQPDYWSTSHVLYFYFIMRQGWTWWGALLLAFFFEGFIEVVLFPWATVEDGLVVDPLQAVMGISAFLLFKETSCAVVAAVPPKYNAGIAAWASYFASYWYFALAGIPSIIFHQSATLFEEHNWAFAPAFAAMAVAAAYMDRDRVHGARLYVPLIYVSSVGGLVAGVNEIPFNPWMATAIMHLPILLLYAALTSSCLTKRGPKTEKYMMVPLNS